MQSDEAPVFALFRICAQAIQKGELIQRESRRDKEFHFQNWVARRLSDSGLYYELGGRNSYPDIRMVATPEGFEVKGLAYPGREASYDCNSQVPTGYHNGRAIYYVFGRYPAEPDGDAYPVLDAVICHGDFLNADHDYVHKNRNVKGFGSYGDIMIRDRKMYVAPTPFGLLSGVAHRQTLIVPADSPIPADYQSVGTIVRVEASSVILGYTADLRTNTLVPLEGPNPFAGREHAFQAVRVKGMPNDPVALLAKS